MWLASHIETLNVPSKSKKNAVLGAAAIAEVYTNPVFRSSATVTGSILP